ncbi:MAG: glutamate-5-semialdehyde dehydrogenase [Lachnospiraceae bacterium]|nr:glutamate-5-semialdehyde dehydrogenase [Lachnospiraceae bacterium]
MVVATEAKKMKKAAPILAASSVDKRNNALDYIAKALEDNKDKIFAANRKDLDYAKENDIAESVIKRLKYDEAKLKDSISGLIGLKGLDDPIGKVYMKRELDSDLLLTKISVPIGVIGVIFEARPDALIQVASLCIKSGNCAVLKGGKETANTNKVLFEIIKDCVIKAGLPGECLLQVEQHNEIDELLKCDEEVDLLIPRGSNKFVRYIMENTKIPVMGHSSGICHIYVDEMADVNLALKVILDAKKQYAAACNAVETVLINRKIADTFTPALYEMLMSEEVTVNGTKEVEDIVGKEIGIMAEDEFAKEYNDYEISLKIVDGVDEAIEHINYYGSHHTDAIITEDDKVAETFTQMVDSAGVYVNCSTRFADGYRYGFGAEVGISTGKLHARGPVGLDGLVTYKYILKGDGNIVGDYASGKRNFNHKDV